MKKAVIPIIACVFVLSAGCIGWLMGVEDRAYEDPVVGCYSHLEGEEYFEFHGDGRLDRISMLDGGRKGVVAMEWKMVDDNVIMASYGTEEFIFEHRADEGTLHTIDGRWSWESVPCDDVFAGHL